MKRNLIDLKIPLDLIPRCPKCGWQMVPWVNDDTFLRGDKFKDSYKLYCDFVRQYHDKKIVLISLGVGDMTPSIIKLPFWQMTEEYNDCFLINVTLDLTTPPLHLENKNLNFIEDIDNFLKNIIERVEV